MKKFLGNKDLALFFTTTLVVTVEEDFDYQPMDGEEIEEGYEAFIVTVKAFYKDFEGEDCLGGVLFKGYPSDEELNGFLEESEMIHMAQEALTNKLMETLSKVSEIKSA